MAEGSNSPEDEGLTRRDFLKGVAAGVVVGAAATRGGQELAEAVADGRLTRFGRSLLQSFRSHLAKGDIAGKQSEEAAKKLIERQTREKEAAKKAEDTKQESQAFREKMADQNFSTKP